MQAKARAVALYFYRIGNTGGGAERMICQLANALAERGFKVHIVSWDQAGANTFYPLSNDVRWHCLGFKAGWRDKLRRTRALAGILREHNIPILTGFVMSGDKTIYAAALLAGVQLVAAERNAPAMYYLRYKWYQRWLSFALLHLCKRIVVQFPGYVSGYLSSLRPRIVAIPNPVTPAPGYAQPDQPGADGRYVLLAAGRLDAIQKGFECLLRAFGRIAHDQPGWILQLVGDGPQKIFLQHQISELKLDNRVFIIPSIRDISNVYCRAHLFVIPSRWEGFPNVLAEAMSHGLPAVGFAQAAGVNQLIVDGVSGWLADGLDDEKSLASVLLDAMTNAQERMRRGHNAIQQMKTYEPEKQYQHWESLFMDMISG